MVVDKLVVKNSELVWVLNVDVICLSHHGNLLDVCCLATTAALRNSKEYSILLALYE